MAIEMDSVARQMDYIGEKCPARRTPAGQVTRLAACQADNYNNNS